MAPIQPGQTAVGWVAFVAPQWALQTLNARATDLEFLLSANGDAGPSAAAYIGQIRLWKAAKHGRRSSNDRRFSRLNLGSEARSATTRANRTDGDAAG